MEESPCTSRTLTAQSGKIYMQVTYCAIAFEAKFTATTPRKLFEAHFQYQLNFENNS